MIFALYNPALLVKLMKYGIHVNSLKLARRKYIIILSIIFNVISSLHTTLIDYY